MPRIKSLVTRIEVDVAKRAHNCQGNARHRIESGDKRLKVRRGARSWDHYCLECAKAIVQRDVVALQEFSDHLAP